jgi:integrase
MSVGKITKRSVDALVCPAGKRETVLWDAELRRFGVFAYKSGVKTYKVQYVFGGKEKRVKIGAHGVFTAEEARIEAKRLLMLVDRKIDPLAKPSPDMVEPTFNKMADEFMKNVVMIKREASTATTYEGLLRVHIRPAIGHLLASEVTTEVVMGVHTALKKTPGAANRMLSLISVIWNFSKKTRRKQRDLFRYNPAEDVEKYPEQQATRYMTLPELRQFGEAMYRADHGLIYYDVDEAGPNAKHAPRPAMRVQRVDPYAVVALRLLLLSGARRNEILKAKWAWVDWDEGLIILPKSKTGKIPKPIVLTAAALLLLRSIPQIEGNEFIIAGRGANEPRSDLKRPWAAIIKATGMPHITLHGLRHSFASAGLRNKLGLPMIGALLGHSQTQTTKRYAHLDVGPMRDAAEQIGTQIEEQMLLGSSRIDTKLLAVTQQVT